MDEDTKDTNVVKPTRVQNLAARRLQLWLLEELIFEGKDLYTIKVISMQVFNIVTNRSWH